MQESAPHNLKLRNRFLTPFEMCACMHCGCGCGSVKKKKKNTHDKF